ncbi:MAG: hypothetical protein K9M08_12715 [Pirellula sp.]|nr:hypothetical protein [Pirellula sp.]
MAPVVITIALSFLSVRINCVKLNQVTVPAMNIAASVEFYVRMGLELIVSSSHYARFICPDGDSSFSVHLVPELVPWSRKTS